MRIADNLQCQVGCYDEVDTDGSSITQCVCATDLCNGPEAAVDTGILASAGTGVIMASHWLLAPGFIIIVARDK